MDTQVPQLVHWLRESAPYFSCHRDRTFVVAFGGEALEDGSLPSLVHDLALVASLGVRLVLVPGARPQIEERLGRHGAELHYVNGRRITDDQALLCVKEAVSLVRMEIEALLSMGLPNSPASDRRMPVASGNFVTARPVGVRDGVDHLHTGEVRRVDTDAIRRRLDDRALVLVPPIGYSPTGDVFNLYSEDVAFAVARALRADKLLLLAEGDRLRDPEGDVVRELTVEDVRRLLRDGGAGMSPELAQLLQGALDACLGGVRRVHLLDRRTDGALLLELFTRDGVGTLLMARPFETMRRAVTEDVGGILELITPLQQDGTLARRSREMLETGIERFTVIDREGTVIACAALIPAPDAPVAELACFVVHSEYRGGERGDHLLERMERQARSAGMEALFVLTTRTAQWFQERGFRPAGPDDLPPSRRALYDRVRNSRVYIKRLGGV